MAPPHCPGPGDRRTHAKRGNQQDQNTKPPSLLPKSLATLTDLPTELLWMIFQEVFKRRQNTPPNPTQDLVRLGQVCKRLHHAVQPLLYRRVVARLADPDAQQQAQTIDLSCLIRTLWKSRDLGTLIRDVRLDLVRSIPASGRRPPQPLVRGRIPPNRRDLSRATNRFLGTRSRRYYSRLPNDMEKWCYRSAVPVFLLLAMAPNVTVVHLDVGNKWRLDGVATRLPRGTYTPKVTFPSLRDLRLTLATAPLDGMESGGAVRALLASSPNLESLELRRFQPLGPSPVNLPPGLTSLVLYDTEITSRGMAAMIRTTPRLKRLCTYFTSEQSVAYDPLRDAMAAVLGSLPKLPAAQTIEVLGFWGSLFDPSLNEVLAGLPSLKLLAFTCGRAPQLNQGLLTKLLTDCPQLQGLVVNGGERLGRDGLLRFRDAVSNSEFPRFRKLMLVPREIRVGGPVSSFSAYLPDKWEALQDAAKPPLARLLRDRGVELLLEREDNGDMAKPLVAMERAMFSS